MNEQRGASEGSNHPKNLSPFFFLEDADENIVIIVHRTILANLRATAKSQIIYEALDEERRNAYWSWKMKTAGQVPEEVLQLLSTHDRESVLYYMQQHRLDKAFRACSYGPAEAQRLFQKWADKIKVSENEEWMEVVFDSAQKTLKKWTDSSNFNDKTTSKSSADSEKVRQETAESSNSKTASRTSTVMDSEKLERETVDIRTSKAPPNEDRTSHTNKPEQQRKDTTPREEARPVPSLRTKNLPRNSTNGEETAPLQTKIDSDITDADKQRDAVEKKSLPQDVSTQPSSSTPKPTEFKKYHNLKALNILLLGETGVGKTTFVNSLANYLRYNTLAEALAGEPMVLVDASFVQGFEENEHLNDAGASCTQSTVEHVFEWMDGEEPKLVRIIDTPGINDTRGAEKDKENLNNIMQHVTQIGKLHAICILMKPNEAKLNHSFRSCIDHLLMSLHRSATTNILFCFTMTRSNMYRPGDSLATLRAYLNKLEHDTGVLIKADSSNLFSFENDCFRYMCAVRQIPELNTDFNMKTFSEGWRHNVPECIKMFKRVEGLVPHSVEDTVSINNTRHMIEKIVRPLADLARNHIVNMKLLQEYIEAAANPDKNGDYLASQVYQEQITMVPKLLAFPRTVCNAPCCVEYIQVNKYQTKTVHKRICHDKCRTTSILERGKPENDLKYCLIFEKRNGWCEVCNCHWKQHAFEIYELQYETNLVKDVAAKMKVDDYVKRQKTREFKLTEQKEKLRQMQQESDQIRDCCVEMAAFLEKNSVIKGCDPFYENLRQLVEEEENKVVLGLDFDMAVELVNLQVSYKNRVDYVISEINSSRRSVLTTAQLNSMIDSLALMKYAGPTFACLRDYQLSADATAHQAENLAPPPDLIRENIGNAQPSNSYGYPRNRLYPDLQ